MTTRAPVDIGKLIVCKPGVKGGRPCLAGTGMMVRTVAVLHETGLSGEAILAEFPDLDLARIHAALAYYFANQAAIDADLEAERKLEDAMAKRFPNGWSRETDPTMTGAADLLG